MIIAKEDEERKLSTFLKNMGVYYFKPNPVIKDTEINLQLDFRSDTSQVTVYFYEQAKKRPCLFITIGFYNGILPSVIHVDKLNEKGMVVESEYTEFESSLVGEVDLQFLLHDNRLVIKINDKEIAYDDSNNSKIDQYALHTFGVDIVYVSTFPESAILQRMSKKKLSSAHQPGKLPLKHTTRSSVIFVPIFAPLTIIFIITIIVLAVYLHKCRKSARQMK